MSTEQFTLFPLPEKKKSVKRNLTSTFTNNMKLPIHGWYRYSAGFSAEWAAELIGAEKANGRTHVLDPFAGSGTTLLSAELQGVNSVGVEAHPFVARIAKAKLLWRENPEEFVETAITILGAAKKIQGSAGGYPQLISKCFPPEILARLDSLREAWDEFDKANPTSELVWLALVSILRQCSPVGTAQWQYVLPKKSKAKFLDPYDAFYRKVMLMADDMRCRQRIRKGPKAKLHQGDVRLISSLQKDWTELIVTSPPYANNYDYADATRLEMCFFKEINAWRDLQSVVRQHLLRSCTQHVAKMVDETEALLASEVLEPIRNEITKVCSALAVERLGHGGKKPYHTMIAAYFCDLGAIWKVLRDATAPGALACFVIGDSAPYGVYVPVDRWLGELAVSVGFSSYRFEKTRDRNVKWKNRKHRVPLHEGRLWVEG